MEDKIIRDLVKAAKDAMGYAYVPYSNYPVGAALLTKDDKIITGCNIENASYGLTNCAERTALFKAVSEGITDFKTIAIICKGDLFASPCGACRQVIAEFLDQGTQVILANEKEEYQLSTVEKLLPGAFTPKSLKGEKNV